MNDELMQAIEAEYEAEFAAEFSDGYKPKPKPRPKRDRKYTPRGLSDDERVAWIYDNLVEEDEHGCLVWVGNGLPQVWYDGKRHYARRWLWTQLTGSDEGHTLCARRGRDCLNLEHDEVVGRLRKNASVAEAVEHAMTYRVDKGGPDDCWPWQGPIDETGYGRFTLNGKTNIVHRAFYEHYNGPLNGEPVHHTCANRWCVNPAHLQRVSQRENVAEMRERNYYIKRIADLEAQVAEQDDKIAELEERLSELELKEAFHFFRERLHDGRG